jgi:cytochrome c oxidase subunit 2
MVLAVVLVLLVIGSLLFHFLSPWYFTPLASNWSTIDFTVDVTFWVTGIVFIAVNLFMAYAVMRYRHRKDGERAHYEPENKKLELWLTVVTSVGVAAMLAPGLIVWGDLITAPEEAVEVEAVGQQWHWSFRFPGEDGVLGTTDVRHMSPTNPLGINPEDPSGQDDKVVAHPEVHLPLGQPVKLLLRSKDVLHNFTVPQFRTKMDLVPGMVTYIWLTPTSVGTYEILCEELCGLAHFAMRGRTVVEEPAAFEAWLAAQPTFADTAARPPGNAVAGAALYTVCSACHGTQGEGNLALNAPKLSGQEPWYLKRQLVNYKLGLRGAAEEDVFGRQMAPMAQVLADDTAIENVVAHIGALPDNPAPTTVVGDPARGQELFMTCAACHGRDGQGIWGTNAPRLAGMSDWYLVTQLKNFRSNVRGGHPQDVYGEQMAMMAMYLADDQAINDLVAYVKTL